MPEPEGRDTAAGERFLARQPAAVDSAFAVLEKVAELGVGVTSRQLVRELPMSKATVYRIVKHLVDQEYLVHAQDHSGLTLGQRVVALARTAAEGQPRPTTRPVSDSVGTLPAPVSAPTTLESNETSRLSPSSHT